MEKIELICKIEWGFLLITIKMENIKMLINKYLIFDINYFVWFYTFQVNHFTQKFPSRWDTLTSSTPSKLSLNCKADLLSNKNNNTSETPLSIKSWLVTWTSQKMYFHFITIVVNLRECFKFNQRKYVEFCLAHKAPGTSLEEAARELGYRKWSVYWIIWFSIFQACLHLYW